MRYTYHARNENEEHIRKVIDEETERLTDERLRRLAMTQAMTAAEQLRQKGREEGWQDGRKDGRQEGISSIFVKLLKKRFGAVPPTLEEKLGQSNVELLDKFGDFILDFKDLSDAEKWWEMAENS